MPSAQARPRFGVFLPAWVLPGEAAPSAAFLQDFARRAEDVGFDGVWVFDHLFDAPPSYRVVFMEPLTSLALVVGATRRVTLGTGILVLPLRDPVVTAKAVANLDAVSGGRVVFGVGVGWDEKEFRACQVPKETRGTPMRMMDATSRSPRSGCRPGRSRRRGPRSWSRRAWCRRARAGTSRAARGTRRDARSSAGTPGSWTCS